jgi:hypothetical protein
MERYIVHALSLDPLATLRTRGSPKARNEIPNPKARASAAETAMKNGSWVDEGTGASAAGGQITGPNTKAGTPTSTVMIDVLIQVFITFCSLYLGYGRRFGFASFSIYLGVSVTSLLSSRHPCLVHRYLLIAGSVLHR